MIALDLPWGLIVAIKTAVVLSIIPAGALILGYVFLLKMMSHMQSRLGPMDPGGFHGWFQLIGDGIKFIQKEDIVPADADRRVFMAAPAVILISTFLIYLVIPAGPRLVVADLEILHDQVGAGGDHEEHEEGGDHHDRRSEREHPPVGPRRHHVFLLDELDAVADELEPPVEPARVHRPEPALHVGHHLQQEHVAENDGAERDDGEHDDRLDRQDRRLPSGDVEREQAHRSMSPRMK